MRIIKFRGKSIDNGEWVVGSLLVTDDNKNNPMYSRIPKKHYRIMAYFAGDWNMGGWDAVNVDPSTIGQFIGLTDKNGMEIYEGDILLQKTTEKFKEVNSSVWERIYTVIFGSCDFNPGWSGHNTYCFYLQGTKPKTTKGVGKISSDNITGYYPYEVIGNIHDNKELLK